MTKISVVMSVFNGARHLAGTIESILAQTETDFELIIIDDGSQDETPAILQRFAAADPRIRVITVRNAGLTRALIAGCAAATAPLIARQDAGDLSHPERLAKQAALFDRWPELAFASCAVDFVGPGLEYLHSSRGQGATLVPKPILDITRIPPVLDGPSHHGAVLFRRDAYERAGGYRSEFYYGQDWDLWYRLAEGGAFARIPETLYTARILPDSISTAALARQEAIAELSRTALVARQHGESDAPILARAAAIGPVPRRTSRRRAAAGLYFIGEALRRNGDSRARGYLARSAATWPFSVRTWIRYLQSLLP
ncbi:MAG TPA: glycosyltransferase family 2 protein [Thermoanaerobaculia bacterium]|nr:glycosyltransferase family 2 protein [Thermoanaerobaculia bacterium]